MASPALKLVDDDFTEYGDGDGGGEDVMCCPECEGTDFKLLDDECHSVMCSGCGTIVGVEWLDQDDYIEEESEYDEDMQRELCDTLDSLGVSLDE